MGASFRWEHELSKSFQATTCPRLWSRNHAGTWVVAHESTCSEGRADIVWGRFGKGWSPAHLRPHAALLQNPTASRILSTLRRRAAQDQDQAYQRVGVTLPVFRKWLRALIEAKLVTATRDGRFRAIPRKRFPSIEICAFELKLKNWQRALYQATRYRSFSDKVFVVMPTESARTAYKHRETFQKANIGLVSHDASGKSVVLIRPLKRAPHAEHRSIMAVGMLSGSKIKVRPSYEKNRQRQPTHPNGRHGSGS